MLSYEEFRDLVKRMRQAQTAYFKSKNADRIMLVTAKQLERRVDAELADQGSGDQRLVFTDPQN